MHDSTDIPKKGLPSWVKIGGVCLLWLLLGIVVLASTMYMDVNLNLFDWHAKVDGGLFLALILITVAIFLSWPLSGITRGRVAWIIATLVVLGLAGLSLYLLPAESLNPNTVFGRDDASPFWYRAGRVFMLFMPGVVLGSRAVFGSQRARESLS